MYNFTKGFQLCSFGNNTVNADWKLTSKDNCKLPILGSAIDMEHLEQLPKAEYILDKLNLGGCFDFEYTPSHRDRIEWQDDNKTIYTFKYDFDKWVNDSDSTNIFGLALAS